MFKKPVLLIACLGFTVLIFCCLRLVPKADRIYIHARIWTGDPQNPWAEALAIKGTTIVFVGKDYRSYQSPRTVVVDLHGSFMVPGFIDSHTHFLAGGYSLANLNLHGVSAIPDFIRQFGAFAKGQSGAEWIENGNWDNERWGGELPHKEWIDSLSGLHPVFIKRYDIHMGLANSLALKLAKIGSKTPDPAGGQIVRDPKTGEPTGILKDNAMDLMIRAIPEPSHKQLDRYLSMAQHEAFSHGLTQVHDMSSYGGWTDLGTYQRAHQNGTLKLRVYAFVPIFTWARLAAYVRNHGRGDMQLRWGGLKAFVDGSLGSTTAWLNSPYKDAPTKTGLQITDTVVLQRLIISADSAGLQVASHAIGDHANDFIMNAYQQADRHNGVRDRRFRVEHAQHLTAAAIPRFGQLGVIPSMQPYHLIDDGKWAAKRLDSNRLKNAYAFKSLLATGATVTFGSDWTVAPLEPLKGIYAAVTRRTLDDKNPDGWYPAQKIKVDQALRCYTRNAAFAGFQENVLGRLKAGMLADMVVLSADLFEIRPEEIWNVRVLRTIVGGEEVFQMPKPGTDYKVSK